MPRSWLKSTGNVLVLFEEIGGDPTQISFATQELESLCSHVSESHPIPMEAWSQDKSTRKLKLKSKPRVSLKCPHPNHVISSIKFASFGTPKGKCGSFSHGECRSTNALSTIQKVNSFDFDYLMCIYVQYIFSLQIVNIAGMHWVKNLQR